ncbi:hypothetical protein T08_9598 [Trichinella sp. T8]|nr:hypothetical protein T08_9598 [Trichinella sp. T8]
MEFKILKFIFGWSSVRVQCFAFESYLNHFLFCSSFWTNLDVTYVITQKDHIESCPVDEHLAYRMEKRRTTMAGEDFLLWQSASSHILVLATGSNIRLMATRRTWALDGTFKVVPQ